LDRRIRTSLFSITANLLLISILGTASYVTGSLAILADAYHSFSDLIVSLTVLTSLLLRSHLERKVGRVGPASNSSDTGKTQTPVAEDTTDRAEPGYWIESLVAFAVSLVILYTAYAVVSKVLATPPDVQIRNVALGVIGVTACVSITYFISRFKIIVGHEADSPALVADGYHSRMDMFTSIAVLLSLMGQWIGIKFDSLVAVVIAVLIAITGINLLISSFVSFIRKSHFKEEIHWERIFSLLNRIIGFVSQHLFRRRLALPRIDFTRLHPRVWLTRRLIAGLSLLLIVIYLRSGITAVRPDEVGVRFRFGAIVDDHLEPGLHFAFPWPFEGITRVNARRIYRAEIGFRIDPALLKSVSPLLWEAKHKIPGYQKIQDESVALTGDENIVDFSIVVHYRPRDAVIHLFQVNKIHDVIRGLSHAHMLEVLATERAYLMMTDDRRRVLNLLQEMISRQVDRLGLGLEVLAVYCHDLHPPLETVAAFRDVFSAREDKVMLINEAESQRNEAFPKTRAEGKTMLAEASAFEIEKKLRAEGEAQKFLLAARAYREEPEITGYRLFIETVEQGLAGKKKYIANPKANLGGYRLWMYMPRFIPE